MLLYYIAERERHRLERESVRDTFSATIEDPIWYINTFKKIIKNNKLFLLHCKTSKIKKFQKLFIYF